MCYKPAHHLASAAELPKESYTQTMHTSRPSKNLKGFTQQWMTAFKYLVEINDPLYGKDSFSH
jgi:hypothetical protein